MAIMTVSAGSNASLYGSYAGSNIVIQGGGTLVQTIDSGGFTNSSGVTISNQSGGRLGILGNSSYALTNAVGALIANAGTIYGNGVLHNDGAIVNNSGTISIAASSTAYGVDSNGAVLVSVNNTQGTVYNAGTISNAGLSRAFLIVGGSLVNQSGGQLQNYAVVRVQSATSGSYSYGYYNSESQSYSYAPVTTATAAGQFANFGTVFNARGAEFNVSGSLTNYNGGTFVNDGRLNVNSLGSVANYGLLAGVGTNNGNLTDYGIISGGDVVTHTGNMIFQSGTVTIESGASAANISIGTGGSFQDKSGGTVSNVTVGSGARLTVSAGATASNVTVVSGGVIDLLSGASVTSLTMSAGGVEQVGSGEVQTGAVSGVNYAVVSGGKFNGTVSSGATLTVSSGGVVSGAVVASGGVIQLISGASITALTLNRGAIEQVGQGYVQTDAAAGVNYQVLSGGSLVGTVSSTNQGILDGRGDGITAMVTVSSGGMLSAVTVVSSASIQLLGGAQVASLTLNTAASGFYVGAIESVGSGYVQTNAMVSGASYQVLNGGAVVGTVGDGARVTVSSGGTASRVTVASGGVINLFGGASLTSVTLQPGASEVVRSGYTQTNAISGINYTLSQGGVFSGTVSAGARVVITGAATVGIFALDLYTDISRWGGLGSNVVVASGGYLQGAIRSGANVTVMPGGSLGGVHFVYGTLSGGSIGTISNGTSLHYLKLMSGGSISGATIMAGGTIELGGGGTVAGVTVNSAGKIRLSSGRVNLSGLTVQAGVTVSIVGGSLSGAESGVNYEVAGPTYVGTLSGTVSSGALVTVSSGGILLSATVASGGVVNLLGGASVTALTLNSGAIESVGSGYIQTDGVSGANYQVLSNGKIVGTVSAGALVTVSSGGAVSGATVASGGTVILNGGSATGLTLNQGAVVDFNNVNYDAGETVTVNNGVLQLLNSTGGVLASATLASGTFTGASYTLSQDGDGSARVFVAICYLEGTNILTPKGELTVESLKAGDTVVTRFGGLQKIRWVGRQSFRGEAIQNDWTSVPVHIRAGALGDGLPSRDLYVSPGHSMLMDGTLLLAKHLVNGVTITQGWVPEQVEYYQLDLGAHDCVLAEGTWSETYADAGTLRDEFDNAEDFTARFPNYRAPEEIALCAPRPQKGEALAKGLLPVLARAGELVSGKLRGQVDKVNGGFKVEGWAQDLANPDFPVMLEVLHDGMLLGEVLACEFRPDLLKAGIGRGYSAFTFVSPVRLTAEMHAGLAVRRKSDGASLGINPEIAKAAASAMAMPVVAAVAAAELAKSPVSPSQPPQLRVVGNAT